MNPRLLTESEIEFYLEKRFGPGNLFNREVVKELVKLQDEKTFSYMKDEISSFVGQWRRALYETGEAMSSDADDAFFK